MRIIAHRGYSGKYPENTLLAFEKAIEAGATWIELDAYCLENNLIVFHDETLERTTNGKGNIVDSNLKHLRSLDAGKGEKIPFLKEVFELATNKLSINIELKGPSTAKPSALFLQEKLKQGWSNSNIIVSSFDHVQLQEFASISPEIPIGVLIHKPVGKFIHTLKNLNSKFLHTSLEHINKEIVDKAHDSYNKVFIYTVNTEEDFNKVRALGVDGIFTDEPKQASEWIKK